MNYFVFSNQTAISNQYNKRPFINFSRRFIYFQNWEAIFKPLTRINRNEATKQKKRGSFPAGE